VEPNSEGKKVHVDNSKCITCGQCLRACTHDARDYNDDTSRFLADIKAGKKISLITAPALRPNVPLWQNLLGCLKALGANMIYDTSYGADICTWMYLKHINETGTTGLIAQPCPPIVSYIEHYVPELLSRLAPIHSPAICAAIYMKEYKNIPGPYAFLSPCVAKGDEFTDPNTNGLIGYNVTFKKLLKTLKEDGIDYRQHAPATYDNPPHGLGAIYSSPGGLKANIEAHIKGQWIYKTEGQPHTSKFLHEYVNERVDAPLVVDILSCKGGCNSGTGACHAEDMEYTIEKSMHGVKAEAQETKPNHALFDKELRPQDFYRKYTPKKIMPIFVDRHEMESAFAALHKPSHEHRTTDCRACGYATCQEMAIAVAKGINRIDNCFDYMRSIAKKEVAND